MFDKYVSEQKKHYKSGKVRFSGNYYSILAVVFIDSNNWNNDPFVYVTGVKKMRAEGELEATVVTGRTIFGRVLR